MNAPPTAGREPVLRLDGICVDYLGEHADTHAVSDVSLTLHRGEILGLAGESGCGKSTLAYAMNRLTRPPAEIVGGTVTFIERDGTEVDVLALRNEQLRAFRWKKMAMVFQGAMNALNPVLTVRAQIEDVLEAHEPGMTAVARRQRAAELLDTVGVDPRRLRSYPHELSGGMRQRVMIAMALALKPDIMVMDEPTTALDVVVQRDILREIIRLRDVFGFAVVFITHDLSMLLEISDQIAIMYAGRIVEHASADRLLAQPQHPYTVGLLNSFPSLTGPRRELHGIPGSPPDLSGPVTGCPFAPRCPYAAPVCRSTRPPLVLHPASPGGQHGPAACHAHDPAVYPGTVPPPALLRGEFRPVQETEEVSA